MIGSNIYDYFVFTLSICLLFIVAIYHTNAVLDSEENLVDFKINGGTSDKEKIQFLDKFSQSPEAQHAADTSDMTEHHLTVIAYCQRQRNYICQWKHYNWARLWLRKHAPKYRQFDDDVVKVNINDLLKSFKNNVKATPENVHSQRLFEKKMYKKDFSDKLSLPTRECERVSAKNMTSQRFWNEYVTKSRPVIIEGAMTNWRALERWRSLQYILKEMGDKNVVVSVTPDDNFDVPVDAKLWGLDEDLIVERPAHINVTFHQFLGLTQSKFAANASFYLEYFPLAALNSKTAAKDVLPLKFSEFLATSFRLLWVGNTRTNGRLHLDKYENLMAMVVGTKRFTIFDPSQSSLLYANRPMRQASLVYGWDGDGNAQFVRNRQQVDPQIQEMHDYSPVNLNQLELSFIRYPRLRESKPIICEVSSGEVLYVPSYWWHEVESFAAPNPGLAIGVNHFMEPAYTRSNGNLSDSGKRLDKKIPREKQEL